MTVNHLLHHLTTSNDHNPPRHTGVLDAFQTHHCIADQDNMSLCARLTGTNEDSSTNIDDSKTTISPGKLYHHCQCVVLSQPGTASDHIFQCLSLSPASPKKHTPRWPAPWALQTTATPAHWVSPPWALPALVPQPQVPPMVKHSLSKVVIPPSLPGSYFKDTHYL